MGLIWMGVDFGRSDLLTFGFCGCYAEWLVGCEKMDRASVCVRKRTTKTERVDDSTRPGEGADDGFRYTRPSRARATEEE